MITTCWMMPEPVVTFAERSFDGAKGEPPPWRESPGPAEHAGRTQAHNSASAIPVVRRRDCIVDLRCSGRDSRLGAGRYSYGRLRRGSFSRHDGALRWRAK